MQTLGPLLFVLQISEALITFFNVFYLYFSDWLCSIDLSWSVLAFSAVISFLLSSSYSKFLTLDVFFISKVCFLGNSLVVQWLGLVAFTAGAGFHAAKKKKVCFLFMSFVSLLRLSIIHFKSIWPYLLQLKNKFFFYWSVVELLQHFYSSCFKVFSSNVCIISALMYVVFSVSWLSSFGVFHPLCPHQGSPFWSLKAGLESFSWYSSFLYECSLLGFRLPCI